MAAYAVAAGDRGAYEIAATADVEDTVTFGDDLPEVEIKVLAGGPVYFTLDNTAATVRGAHTYDAHNGKFTRAQPPTPGGTVVRLITSVLSTTYSVSAV